MQRPPAKRRRTTASAATTIDQVAARAGVSTATVSRVLNRKGVVRERTAQHVLEVARLLRYVPHAAARSLSARRTSEVGVILPDLHGEFFSEVIRGMDLSARSSGYHILVSGSHSDPKEMNAMLLAVRGRVDGLIVMWPHLDAPVLGMSLPGGIPVVLLNAVGRGQAAISIDNYGGAVGMVNHLARLGHRRITFICGPGKNVDARDRVRGFRDAAANIAVLESVEEISGDFTEEAGYRAGREIVSLRRRPDAIFAANDAMAIGALSALQEAGLRVPNDVAIVGFDDIPIARYVTPRLTTVNVAISELGRRAFELLLDLVQRPEEVRRNRRETVASSLVIRESCGAGLVTARQQPVRRTRPQGATV